MAMFTINDILDYVPDVQTYGIASFDEEIVMNQFAENGVDFIGRNRPVIFLDIQIDNGFNKPFKMGSMKQNLSHQYRKFFKIYRKNEESFLNSLKTQ